MSIPGSVVTAFIKAIEAKDLDAALALVVDDVSYENVPMAPIRGKATVRTVLDGFLGSATEVQWRVSRQVESGNVVVNERVDRFQIGDGWLELPVAGFFEVTPNGLISLWRDYFDMASYTRQMAVLSPS